MPRIFISYSRKDDVFARKLATSLSDLGADIWIDVKNIPAGMKWQNAIDQGLRLCEAMIVIITPDSMASNNVEDEWQFFRSEKKLIIPILLKPTSQIPYQLLSLQRIDFHAQLYNVALAKLVAELGKNGLILASSLPPAVLLTKPPSKGISYSRIIPIVVIVMLTTIIAVIVIVISQMNTPSNNEVVIQPTSMNTPSSTLPTSTSMQAAPCTITTFQVSPSESPQPVGTILTLQGEGTCRGNIPASRFSIDGGGYGEDASTGQQLETWTLTEGEHTICFEIAFGDWSAAARQCMEITGEAETMTTPTENGLGFSNDNPITNNGEWRQYIDQYTGTFSDIQMVLVPVGCFDMGYAGSSETDDRDVHEQCFEEPFWIARTETTNGQYGSASINDNPECNSVQAGPSIGQPTTPDGPNFPRDCISWTEALGFCESLDLRLPTEAEWEYAARGPSNWRYPWGNDFNENNAAVIFGVAPTGASPVDSYPDGASWVGALEMSGNMWEWTSSIYRPYPYVAEDGRESTENEGSSSADNATRRVVRGGGWDNTDENATSYNRSNGFFTTVWNSWGFRCARDFQPSDLETPTP